MLFTLNISLYRFALPMTAYLIDTVHTLHSSLCRKNYVNYGTLTLVLTRN